MACLVSIGSFTSFVLALTIRLKVFFYVGVGGIISSVLIFSLGLLAVLLRQIMVKSSRIERDGRIPVDGNIISSSNLSFLSNARDQRGL
jgi:hypothetical protein